MGDAQAGVRALPSAAVTNNSVEGKLLACCSADLRANILIVGHHGSKTSSRSVFSNAVAANSFVISSGPNKYGDDTLPDVEIVQELERRGKLFRTDLDDQKCKTNFSKIGPDNDGEPGGCDNIRIVLSINSPPEIL